MTDGLLSIVRKEKMKNLKEKKDFWEGGLFNRSKEKGGSKKNESKKEGVCALNSKTESFKKL